MFVLHQSLGQSNCSTSNQSCPRGVLGWFVDTAASTLSQRRHLHYALSEKHCPKRLFSSFCRFCTVSAEPFHNDRLLTLTRAEPNAWRSFESGLEQGSKFHRSGSIYGGRSRRRYVSIHDRKIG